MRYRVLQVIIIFCSLLFLSCGSQKSVVKSSVDQVATRDLSRIDTAHTDSSAFMKEEDKAVAKASTKDTSVSNSEDSVFTETTIETTFYDTSHTDKDGNPLIAKREVKKITNHSVSRSHTGREVSSLAENSRQTSSLNQSSKSASQCSVVTFKDKIKTKSETNAEKTKSESKQAKYIAMILYGIAGVILMAIVLYVVVMWYRARDRP